jgi:hypothetical protein
MYSLQQRLFSLLIGIALALTLFQFSGSAEVQAAASQQQEGSYSQATMFGCYNCYHFYGSNQSWMYSATNDWYQHKGNWCGIANIRTIQVYDWLYYNGSAPKLDNSQEAIYSRLNSNTSPWGSGNGYVRANISRDFGTDPRAISYGTWVESPPSSQSQPYWFHNRIYRTDNLTATYDFSADFGANTVTHNDPISVTIDGGFHSYVVDGVWAFSDPSQPGGSAIRSIDTWDSWLNHANNSPDGTHPYNQTQQELWALSDWTSLAKLWGQGYNTNNGSDPEPDTPNHYYVPPFPGGFTNHWNTYFITIEQDDVNDAQTSHDYALDQNGSLAPHN